MNNFLKVCWSIIIFCCLALGWILVSCQTNIGQVEWIENPQDPVFEETINLSVRFHAHDFLG